MVLPDLIGSDADDLYVKSQCTYRCVVLPDNEYGNIVIPLVKVSMHLQVRGAP